MTSNLFMFKEEKKSIVVLSEKEHIRQKPTIYVGSVKPSDEKLPIIKNGKIYIEQRIISVGLYKLFDEVFSNSLDEAKRMKGKMKSIDVSVESGSNRMIIKDSGNGFYKGTEINKISGKTNIETAVSQLRAGSNFSNDDVEESLVGTNGMGVSLVNVLSKKFRIITVNDTHIYEQEWIDYEASSPKISKNNKKVEKGTEVSFQPLCSVFSPCKWDKDILSSILSLKRDLIKKDPEISSLQINFYWDDLQVNISGDVFTRDSYLIQTPIGQISIWEKYEGSGSVSFINSAMCSGIHQKIFNDIINEKLDDSLGHHFYDTYITLNLPPKIVRFGDQNKTKFVSQREEVEPHIIKNFANKLASFFKTPIFESIKKKVDERKNEGHIKKLKSEKRKIDLKKSHKYFPADKNNAENLFIVEGLCIEENEKINIWRNGELMNIKLKDVLIGDEVITHEHRIRKIVNKQRKLKECVTINLKDGTVIIQPGTHRYYVFNSDESVFEFISVNNIDIRKHRLVRSILGEFIGNVEVIDKIYDKESSFPNLIITEDGIYQCTDNHKFCTFDTSFQSFYMKESSEIKIGDLICVFDKI